jgi:hypothetical protein
MLSSYAPAMRSHFFQETAARDFAAPHEPAGRAIIFGNRNHCALAWLEDLRSRTSFPLARTGFPPAREGAVRT